MKPLIALRTKKNYGCVERTYLDDLIALIRKLAVTKQIIHIRIFRGICKFGSSPILIERNKNCSDDKRSVIGYYKIVGHFGNNDNMLSVHSPRKHLGCKRSYIISKLNIANAYLFFIVWFLPIRESDTIAVCFRSILNNMTYALKFSFGV